MRDHEIARLLDILRLHNISPETGRSGEMSCVCMFLPCFCLQRSKNKTQRAALNKSTSSLNTSTSSQSQRGLDVVSLQRRLDIAVHPHSFCVPFALGGIVCGRKLPLKEIGFRKPRAGR